MDKGKKINLGISTIVVLIGILVFISSRQFPAMPEGHPGPGLFPSVLGVFLILSGFVLLSDTFKPGDIPTAFRQGNWRSVLIILSIIVLFPLVQPFIGFLGILSISILAIGLLMRLSLVKSILVSLFTTGFIYLIFNVILHVPL